MKTIEELMQKVHLLEIKAKRLSMQSISGEYRTALKGQGLDFEDFREYQHGDEIRFIDWSVTARLNVPHIRNFREERDQSIVLAIDISKSSKYGSSHFSKREIMAEIAAVLAFSATQNGDKVGLLLFSESEELYLPPQKSNKHTLRIIREIISAEPSGVTTSLSNACDFLSKTLKRKTLIFMISDFIDHDFEKKLGALSRKHETFAIQVFDPVEKSLPKAGKVSLVDAETGHQVVVNTNNPNVIMAYSKLTKRREEGLTKTFRKYNIAHASVSTDDDYLPALHQLFKAGK